MGISMIYIPIIGSIVFLGVGIIFVVVFVGIIRTARKNNHSPVLSVEATLVAKRPHTSGAMRSAGTQTGMMSSSSTFYYVTFQVKSGDRMEFQVSGTEYGMLAEGDVGELTFQGTRYIKFERHY